MGIQSQHWRSYGLIALVAGLGQIGALWADFYMDDHLHILGNEAITGHWFIPEHYGLRLVPLGLWRMIYLLFGANPTAFHAVNWLTHILICLALYWSAQKSFGKSVAAFAAILFGLHPLGTEAVHYASQLSIQLTTLGSVLAFGFAVAGEKADSARSQWMLGLGSLAAILLATFSKEMGLMVACLSWACGWFLVPRKKWQWSPWKILGACGIALLALQKVMPLVKGSWQRIVSEEEAMANLLTQGRAFWRQLTAFLWPGRPCSDHWWPMSTSWSDLPASAGVISAGLLMVICLGGCFEKRFRRLCLLSLPILLVLGLRLFWIQKEHYVEYRATAALPFACVLLGLCVELCWLRWPRWVKSCGLALGLFVLTLNAYRSVDWANAEALSRDVLTQYPLNNRARSLVMRARFLAGDDQAVLQLGKEARQALDEAVADNRSDGQRRKYEATHLCRFFAFCERDVVMSLARLGKDDIAVAHADRVLEQLGRLEPEFIDPTSPFYEVSSVLVQAKEDIQAAAAFDQPPSP